MRSGRDLDEDDVRVRPGRGSRPRTRTRPAHKTAERGFVISVDRGRYRCLVGDTPVTAMRARELGRRAVVVGDRVDVVGDTSGAVDALARIVRVVPRTSTLRRTADDDDPVERVVVANADQLVVVVALADPPPRTGLVDRALVAAFDAGLRPILCLTKADLAPAEPLIEAYAALSVRCVPTRRDEDPAELRELLTDQVSVLVGHSGVGKSTLVNRLVPDADRLVGVVNENTGRGRHTSVSAIALALPEGGWVVDTPGIRSFGLAHVRPGDLLATFPDLAPGGADCPAGCPHVSEEEGCALDAWMRAGNATGERLASFRRLLVALSTPDH